MAANARYERAASWLSRDLAVLASKLAEPGAEDAEGFHFDVVVVGSGYGGAVVLHELAGYGDGKRPLRLLMLERGAEYLPGAFPSLMSELPGHVRISQAGKTKVKGRLTGLFDLRLGPDVAVVQANGLGGGSLINAGVMAEPRRRVLDDRRWPADFRSGVPAFLAQMAAMRTQLGAAAAFSPAGRIDAMDALGASMAAEVTVARQADPTKGLSACNNCGDCASGCNFGAKLSVDVSLIADALLRHPDGFLEVVTGATVKTFADYGADGWALQVLHTDPALAERQLQPYAVRTRRLVLCAGSLGSTELLMRARADGASFASSQLGMNFSSNGDNIVMVHGTQAPALAVSDEKKAFARRGLGPTITRMIDLRDRPDRPMVIEDLGVPGPLRRLLEEVAAYGHVMDQLTRHDGRTHDGKTAKPDPLAISHDKIERSMVLAVIGEDDAKGLLELPAEAHACDAGTLSVRWPDLRLDPRVDALHEDVAALARQGHPGATFLANPLWRPVPPEVEDLVGSGRGPVATVHPLGGCAMGDSAAAGVVDHVGRVFRSDFGPGVHDTLAVLDGAIVPTALGINPSLTIATLAQRGIRYLRDGVWCLQRTPGKLRSLIGRPVFRQMPERQRTRATRFQLTEQMTASARVKSGEWREATVELQLWFKPISLAGLTREWSARVLHVDPARSRLRVRGSPPALPGVLKIEDRPVPAVDSAREVLLEAPLKGTLKLFTHAASTGLGRTLRAGAAWFVNRGLRDIVLDLLDPAPGPSASLPELIRRGLNLASRAGDRRLLKYALVVGEPTTVAGSGMGSAAAWMGQRIDLTKTLTYECAANPLRQLMQSRVDAFPRIGTLRVKGGLQVDLPYFGRTGVPLVRIAAQDDQVRALADLASLVAYIGRTTMPLHAWTFRLPDRPREPLAKEARLPGPLPGLKPPRVTCLPVGRDVSIRLAHYEPADSSGDRPSDRRAVKPRPVLMIHGYSASGTTFAHERLPSGGLAGALCRAGHHVWVLDLRSSAGLPTAQQEWVFEQMACQDIPLAVDHVYAAHGGERAGVQIDVVAHCMGAAMLTLSLFGRGKSFQKFDLLPPTLREALPRRIARIVFSQVGPAVVMSPANTARAYIFQWLMHYMDLGAFQFRPSDKPGPAEDMMDRLLCAVPYPKDEFVLENPVWPPWKRTPWVAQRHRMDALYGVTFRLAGVGERVLERIDDFFGPLNLKTVAQVIWFARSNLVTDQYGQAPFLLAADLAKIRHCRVLALHSTENGLANFETRSVLLEWLRMLPPQGLSVALQDMGHQDSLIGIHADRVYQRIAKFLE